MRININLASNPYELAQEYTRRFGLLVAALTMLTVGLIGYILYQRAQTRDINQQIATAQQQIAGLDAEKAKALAVLNQPQNREVADESQFLNNLFARKALSWTKVFTEMERLMPSNIHVVSMKPEFNRDNQLVLHVVVVTGARDKAVELVKRMEKSPHFRAPQVEAENAIGEGASASAGGNTQFEISAVYVPFAEDIDTSTGDESPEKTKTGGKTSLRGGGQSGTSTAQSRSAADGGGR